MCLISTTILTRLLIDGDIDEIIQHGEERTAELNQKYETLNFDDLNNFKSDSMLQFEGEDYRAVSTFKDVTNSTGVDANEAFRNKT